MSSRDVWRQRKAWAAKRLGTRWRGLVRMVRGRRRGTRPRVLMVIDQVGWAHDFKSRNLRRLLAAELDLEIVPQHEVTRTDVRRADLVLVYYAQQLDVLAARGIHLPSRSVAVGVCSHGTFLADDQRASGVDAMNHLARAVFVNSMLLLEEVEPLVEAPIYYTPNGVDTTFYSPRAPSSPEEAAALRVGWAGSLSNHGPVRGYTDLIVPAVERVGATLVTAAREDRWRGPEEMRDFYRSLDVYVCASSDEGTPNPCLEAAACGVPLVTTRVGNMPEFVRSGENGLFIDRDVASIAGALTQLMDDPDRRRAMGASARATALEWDWAVQAERYRAMFRDLLGEGSAPDQRAPGSPETTLHPRAE